MARRFVLPPFTTTSALLLWLPVGTEQLEGSGVWFCFCSFQTRRQKGKLKPPESGRGPFRRQPAVLCWARALWARLFIYFWSLTHESAAWLGGKTQPTIKEIADELHAGDAVPARHSRLLKISCFLASMSQLELWFLASLSKTQCQAHSRSFNNCLAIAAHRQYMFAVIIQRPKEKHKRLVDFGRAPAPERPGLTWAPGRVCAGQPAAPVRT